MTRTITPDEVLQHLDQIAGLLYAISSWYGDNQPSNWDHVEVFEQQIAAHLQPLRAHWEVTRAVAARHIENYYGSLRYAGAIYVLASGERDQHGLDIVLDALVKAPDETLLSYASMLQRATHPGLAAALATLMDHPKPLVRACAIELLGFRREGNPREIARRIDDPDERVSDAAVLACARLGYRDIVPQVEQRLKSSKSLNPDIALGLLFLGSEPAMHACRACIERLLDPVPGECMSWFAMCGNARDLEVLLARPRTQASVYRAFMILGDTTSIPYLLDDLKRTGPLQELAHQTLKYLTAADVPAPDYSLWREWWRRNTARFSQHPRWRLGRPWSLGECVDALTAAGVPYLLRRDAYLELVIRSGHVIHFEPNWEIPRQRAAAHQWRDWWVKEQHRFIGKPWPFFGR